MVAQYDPVTLCGLCQHAIEWVHDGCTTNSNARVRLLHCICIGLGSTKYIECYCRVSLLCIVIKGVFEADHSRDTFIRPHTPIQLLKIYRSKRFVQLNVSMLSSAPITPFYLHQVLLFLIIMQIPFSAIQFPLWEFLKVRVIH